MENYLALLSFLCCCKQGGEQNLLLLYSKGTFPLMSAAHRKHRTKTGAADPVVETLASRRRSAASALYKNNEGVTRYSQQNELQLLLNTKNLFSVGEGQESFLFFSGEPFLFHPFLLDFPRFRNPLFLLNPDLLCESFPLFLQFLLHLLLLRQLCLLLFLDFVSQGRRDEGFGVVESIRKSSHKAPECFAILFAGCQLIGNPSFCVAECRIASRFQ